MEKLKSSVCADWTVLEVAMKKVQEAVNMVERLSLYGIDRQYHIRYLQKTISWVVRAINTLAHDMADRMIIAQSKNFTRRQRRRNDAKEINWCEYVDSIAGMTRNESEMLKMTMQMDVSGLKKTFFPDLNDLPF